jgi:hypothetical protein
MSDQKPIAPGFALAFTVSLAGAILYECIVRRWRYPILAFKVVDVTSACAGAVIVGRGRFGLPINVGSKLHPHRD